MNTDVTKPPKKPKKHLVSKKTRLEDGQTPVSFHQLEHLVDKDCTMSNNILNTEKIILKKKKPATLKSKKSAIVESLPIIKKTTLKGKSHTCLKNIHNTESFPTLVQESTLKEKASEPCWSSHAKDISKKLWLPTETGCVASHSNWSNGSFKQMESNSWFSIKTWNPQDNQNLQRTCCPSLTFSIVESMEKENTRKKKVPKKQQPNAIRKVQLFPDEQSKKELVKWFGCVRATYNWALACIKKKTKAYKINAYWLRNRFVNKCNIPKDKQWLLETPKEVRYSAIVDLVQGYKLNFNKRKENKNFKFEMKFRSKKNNQSLTIPYTTIKPWDVEKGEMKMYPRFLKNALRFHCRNAPKEVKHDCKLVLDKLGRFYLCVPVINNRENQTVKDSSIKVDWCALDPGVRTFMTAYSPTKGICYQIGKNDISRIYRLCLHLDKLIGKKKTKKMDKAIERSRQRIHHLVDEVHWKTIHFLKNNFNNIILPPFNVSTMIRKVDRKIGKKSVRQMLNWRHYTFRQRLLMSLKEEHTKVHIRGEEYTSKTCTNCMNINYSLGGSKVYKCKNCKVRLDRDVNGARNIFIKNVFLENKSANEDFLC
jgi:putative transposase